MKTLSCIIVFFVSSILHASSILAPKDMGHLVDASQLVKYAKLVDIQYQEHGKKTYKYFIFETIESLKAKSEIPSTFSIRDLSYSFDGGEFKSSVEFNFEINKVYLLFLNKTPISYIPSCLEYGIYQLHVLNNKEYLVPIINYQASEQIGNETKSNLPIYEKSILLKQLSAYINKQTNWNDLSAVLNHKLSDFYPSERAAPSHCKFLMASNKPFRWTLMENSTVNIRYTSGGDILFPNSISATQNAIIELKQNYTGLNITDGGTHNFSPSCSTGSSIGDEFVNFINSTYGTYRNTLILFNDPCEELPDLNNCSGILAVGGEFGINTHSYDGITWNTSGYGYLLMNDNIGPCVNTTIYKLIIEHELSHTIGFDHITSGTANMNPTCCNTIKSLDVQCVDYSYEPILLDIQLIDFTVTANQNQNTIHWQLASPELINIILEFSHNGIEFAPIYNGKNLTEKTTNTTQYPNNYYRLKMISPNGKITHSKIIFLQSSSVKYNKPLLTISNGEVEITNIEPNQSQTTIFSIEGINCNHLISKAKENAPNSIKINTSNLKSGIYLIQINSQGHDSIYKIHLQ